MSAAMMDGFKVSSLGMRPRVPNSGCERKCNDEARRFPTAPRGISHHRSRPVSGLVGSVRIAFPGARAPSGRVSSRTRNAKLGLLVDTPAPLTVAGAAEALERLASRIQAGVSPFLNPRSESASAPLSRFTPARGTRRDTSNERVDCTTQVAGFYLAAASGIYIENESLHLDLTGFLKL